MDTSKSVFVLHGVDAAEKVVLRKKLRRQQVIEFFGKLKPTKIGLEACGAAHYWARELEALAHEVVLLPPQYVKPYVKRGKNDAADAEAICEAMSRPTMRFVPVKTAEQQAALMLAGTRDRLIRMRTQLSRADRRQGSRQDRAAAGAPCCSRRPTEACEGTIRCACQGIRATQAGDPKDRSQADGLAQAQ
jgi:transposase